MSNRVCDSALLVCVHCSKICLGVHDDVRGTGGFFLQLVVQQRFSNHKPILGKQEVRRLMQLNKKKLKLYVALNFPPSSWSPVVQQGG